MVKYNQFRIANGILAEVTDQSVYFEHEEFKVCTAFYYEAFEDVIDYVKDEGEGVVEGDIVVEVTDSFVHLVNNGFTTSIPVGVFWEFVNFYREVKPELRDASRKAVLVWADEEKTICSEVKFSTEECVADVVEEVQSEYSGTHIVEVVPVKEYRSK